jgi:hypothetical protein
MIMSETSAGWGRERSVSTERMTATQYLADRGMSPGPKEQMLRFGMHAARFAAARKLGAAKVRDAALGLMVHTWPADVWDQAYKAMSGGEQPKARPASQRQMAYLGVLWAQAGASAADLLERLGNDMDEDTAGELIRRMGGSL